MNPRTDARCQRIAISGNLATDCHRGAEGKGPALDLGGAAQVTSEANLVHEPPSPKPQ